MKRNTQTWSEYLANPNVRPKTFNVTLQRQRNGQYVVVGHQSLMKDKDGFNENWVRVNSRDLVQSITESGITAL